MVRFISVFLAFFWTTSIFNHLHSQALRSPRKKDIRYYSMGGAYTALVNNSLMSYYNPAAYAFSFEKPAKKRNNFFSGYQKPKKSKRIKEAYLFNSMLAISSAPDENIANLKNLLDYMDILDTVEVPPLMANIFAQFGMQGLITFEDNYSSIFGELATQIASNFIDILQSNVTESSNYFFHNTDYVGFQKAIANLENIDERLSLNLDILKFQTRNFGAGIDFYTDINITAGGTSSLTLTNGFTHSILFPELSIGIEADTIIYFSLATKLKRVENLAFGFTVKAFNRLYERASTEIDLSVIEALQGNTNIDLAEIEEEIMSSVMNSYLGILTRYSAISVASSSPLNFINGNIELSNVPGLYLGNAIGADIGCMYQPLPNLFIGMQFNDVFTEMFWFDGTKEKVPFSLDLGVSYMIKMNFLEILYNPLISLSIEDLFVAYDEPVKMRLHAGIEFGSIVNSFLIRAGIYHGYFAFSAARNFDLKFLRKVPFVKLFFPKKLFKPLFWPKRWNQRGIVEFYRRNPIIWVGAVVGRILTLPQFQFNMGYYGYESGAPGDYKRVNSIALSLSSKFMW